MKSLANFTIVLIIGVFIIALGLSIYYAYSNGIAIERAKDSFVPTPVETQRPTAIPTQPIGNCKVVILVYHIIRKIDENTPKNVLYDFTISPEEFAAEMDYLKENNFYTITFSDLKSALDNEKSLPKKSVIITFDDGHITVYNTAYPILKKNGQKMTGFLVKEFIGTSGYMNQNEIKEMVANGTFEVGSHSVSHKRLADIPKATMKSEVFDSKTYLEKTFNVKVTTIAYPYGNNSPGVIKETQLAGYTFGVTTETGPLDVSTLNPYKLPRFHVLRTSTLNDFKTIVDQLNQE